MKSFLYSSFYCCIAVMLLASCAVRGKYSEDDAETADSAYDTSDDSQGNNHDAEDGLDEASSRHIDSEDSEASFTMMSDRLSPEDEAYEAGHSQGYDDGSADAGAGSDHGTSFDEDNKYQGKAAEQYEEGYNAGYNEGFNELTR